MLCHSLIFVAVAFLGAEPSGRTEGLTVVDQFGRVLNSHGLVLVDWDGYMANPAIRFFVVPPADAAFPAQVFLKANEPRLYFDLPSITGADGPRKHLRLGNREKQAVSLAIFPDRDGEAEDHGLELEFVDAKGSRHALHLPVRVIDQDQRESARRFPIVVDFSKDRTDFFHDEAKRAVVLQAANDWAYFFSAMDLRPVPAGDERTFLWDPDGFKTGRYITNEQEYRGFLLYAYGVHGEEIRSGGEPSRAGGFQVSGTKRLPIRRSGGLEVEIHGNYSKSGWIEQLGDAEWWKATNYGGQKTDLYSVVHHEIGHALIFNPGHERFRQAKESGKLGEPRVNTYLHAQPAIDRTDHLNGTVDPESLRGAFGFEYHGKVPAGRWLITRTDLLVAQAIGYTLRETSAFVPLRIETTALPDGSVDAPYAATLKASGGIPFYHWEVSAGRLPEGLRLDTFSGELRGSPRHSGSFELTVRARDYSALSSGATQVYVIHIR